MMRHLAISILILLITGVSCSKDISMKENETTIPQRKSRIAYEAEDKGILTSGNLSVGKFYTYSRLPRARFGDVQAFEYSDGVKLTDEEMNTGVVDLTKCVGWTGNRDVEITIDLGKAQLVESVTIHGSARRANQAKKPEGIVVMLMDKGEWIHFGKYSPGNPIQEQDELYHVSLIGKNKQATAVKIVITPDQADQTMLLLDEIVVQGKVKNTWRFVPKDGAFHGAYPSTKGHHRTQAELPNGRTDFATSFFEEDVGKKVSMVLWYQNMVPGRGFSEIQNHRKKFMNENYDGNRFLMLGWLPNEIQGGVKTIAEGAYDNYFIQYFKDAVNPSILSGNNDPIWFRPMNEFNGNWVNWSLDPANFRKAWRRMYNIAEKIGAAQQHIFVWSPNSLSYPNTEQNSIQSYYPGDQYVDWVGVSAYPPSNAAISTLFNGDVEVQYPYKNIATAYDLYAHYKPFVIAEGSFDEHIDRVRWVREWFDLKNTRPYVKAVIWENHNSRIISKDEEALQLYREKVQDPYWLSEN